MAEPDNRQLAYFPADGRSVTPLGSFAAADVHVAALSGPAQMFRTAASLKSHELRLRSPYAVRTSAVPHHLSQAFQLDGLSQLLCAESVGRGLNRTTMRMLFATAASGSAAKPCIPHRYQDIRSVRWMLRQMISTQASRLGVVKAVPAGVRQHGIAMVVSGLLGTALIQGCLRGPSGRTTNTSSTPAADQPTKLHAAWTDKQGKHAAVTCIDLS